MARNTRRLTALFAGTALAAGLFAAAPTATAAGPPTRQDLQKAGLKVGTTTGKGTGKGDLYGTGPAKIVKTFCVNGVEDGVICAFTGNDETGTGTVIVAGNATSGCMDFPIALVDNVANETNKPIKVGNGTCAHPGKIVQTDPAGTDSNNPPADAFSCPEDQDCD